MSNNKQSSVAWLSNQTYEIFEQYSEGNFDRITLNKLVLEATNKAKEMEKERELNAYANGQADTLLMFKQKISKMKDIPTEFNQIISENFWDLV
jgi:hypothetical protein